MDNRKLKKRAEIFVRETKEDEGVVLVTLSWFGIIVEKKISWNVEALETAITEGIEELSDKIEKEYEKLMYTYKDDDEVVDVNAGKEGDSF